MVIIGEAMYIKDMISGLAGIVFTAMGILNISCNGSGACYIYSKDTNGEFKVVQSAEVV